MHDCINKLSFSGQHFVGEDFSGLQLDYFAAEGCRFEGCSFDHAVIKDASFAVGRHMCEFVGCSFDQAKLNMNYCGGCRARYVDCSFAKTRIRNWICHNLEMVDCFFSGRIQKAVFGGRVLEHDRAFLQRIENQFEGNDFSQATLVDCSFRRGIDLTKQQLPAGPEYTYVPDARDAVKRARKAVEGWDDPEAQAGAMSLLEVCEMNVEGGQEQLLLRVNDYPPRRRAALQRLMDELVGS